MIQLELATPLGKAFIEENGCSGEYAPAFSSKLHPCSVLVEINNAVQSFTKPIPWGRLSNSYPALHLFLRE